MGETFRIITGKSNHRRNVGNDSNRINMFKGARVQKNAHKDVKSSNYEKKAGILGVQRSDCFSWK